MARTPRPPRPRTPASFSAATAPPPPAVPPASVPRPPPAASTAREVARVVLFTVGLIALHAFVGVLLQYDPDVLFIDFLYFFIPSFLAAILIGAFRIRIPASVRLGLALAIAAAVALAVAWGRDVFPTRTGPSLGLIVESYFITFFPLWAALVVPGPGRYRWRPTQIVGVAILLTPFWRSLSGSLPDLHAAFTPGGFTPAIPLLDLYRTFGLKALRETLLPLAGLFLLLKRFPFLQKRPEWAADWRSVVASIHGGLRRGLALDLGWGALLLVINVPLAIFLQEILSQAKSLDTGDESQVFSQITPDLVLLLSLAAGIGEELLFRGFLQRWLTHALSDLRGLAFPIALVTQALFFGLVHAGYGTLTHLLLPFVFGLFMGLVYRYFGLLPCILIHVEIDVFAFGYDAGLRHGWVNVATGLLFLLNLAAAIATLAYEGVRFLERRRRKGAVPP